MKFIYLFLICVVLFGFVSAAYDFDAFHQNATGEANCSEQLSYCVEVYNSLLTDLRNGTNCDSDTFSQLKTMNHDLAVDREFLREEVDNLKTYKVAFYILFILFVIFLAWMIIPTKSGRLNNGKTSGTGKKTN